MTVSSFTFRGNTFKFIKNHVHASWWSFEDEAAAREDLWKVGFRSLVLDIGCAFGPYTLCALANGASNVIAWSPDGNETSVLQQSLDENRWGHRCVIHNVGLYSKEGWLDSPTQTFSTTPFDEPPLTPSHAFQVKTLDSFLDSLPAVESDVWVKIDVEGAELEVLRGGMKTLKNLLPYVFVENHEFMDPGIGSKVQKFMEDLGWTLVETRPYHAVTHSLFSPPGSV